MMKPVNEKWGKAAAVLWLVALLCGATYAFGKITIQDTNKTVVSGDGNLTITTEDVPGINVGGDIALRGKWYSVTPLYQTFAQVFGRKETAGDGTNSGGYFGVATPPTGGSPIERFRVTSTGLLGINTTTPRSYVDAWATSYASSTANSMISATASDFGIDKGGSIGLGGVWYTVTPSYQNFAILSGRKENATDGTNGGYMNFATQAAGGAMTDWMRLTSLGFLGVGTVSPTDRLTVGGAISATNGAISGTTRGVSVSYDQAGTEGVITAFNPGVPAYEGVRVDASSFRFVDRSSGSIVPFVANASGITVVGATTNVGGLTQSISPSTDTTQGSIRMAMGNGSTNAVDGIANIQSITNPIGGYLPLRLDGSSISIRTDPTTVTTKSHFYVSSAGLIGVGTDAPAEKVQVQGVWGSGTGTISSTGTAVTGSGTAFLTELKVGGTIRTTRVFNVEYKVVTAVSDDTHATVAATFAPDLSGAAFVYSYPSVALKDSGEIQIQTTVTSKPACAADSDVGRWVSYSKSAGATISMCFCQKVASSYLWAAIGTGDCT